jgi:hypothetical protein
MKNNRIKSKLPSIERGGVKGVQNEIEDHRMMGGLRSAEGNRREPILAVEHQWESEALIQEEER